MLEDYESEKSEKPPNDNDVLNESRDTIRLISSEMIAEDDDLRREIYKDPFLRDAIPCTESRSFLLNKSSLDGRLTGDFDEALNSINQSLEINPDDAFTRVSRSSIITHQMSLNVELTYDEKMAILNKVVEQYKEALKLNPTFANSLLGLLEVYCLQRNYDAAIGIFGSSGDYINVNECNVVRSWLGCIALVLAGDMPDNEDSRYLYDQDIRLGSDDWCVAEIDRLMVDLKREGQNRENVGKAIKIHQEFLSHFDQEPYRIHDHYSIDAV